MRGLNFKSQRFCGIKYRRLRLIRKLKDLVKIVTGFQISWKFILRDEIRVDTFR